MQSKRLSLFESVTNTAIGFLIALCVQLIIYPILDIPVTFGQNLTITSVFTFVSIARGYLVRRIFNTIK